MKRLLTLKASVVAFKVQVEDLEGSSAKTKAECFVRGRKMYFHVNEYAFYANYKFIIIKDVLT